jgi:nucleobase:cation symporter-1, NCS1 family
VIGPLFGILIVDFYVIKKQRIEVDDLFSMDPGKSYSYRNGWNPVAIISVIIASVLPISFVIWGTAYQASFTWFMGAAAGAVVYWIGMTFAPKSFIYDTGVEPEVLPTAKDGTLEPSAL